MKRDENMVSVLKCDNYDYENMLSVVRESFNNIGGIEKYINKGDKVLLKANLIMKKNPDEAATTHPALIYALAKTLVGMMRAYIMQGVHAQFGRRQTTVQQIPDGDLQVKSSNSGFIF